MIILSKSARVRRRREYLTADEVERLLAASKTTSRNPERDYAILLLAYRHGLRVSELCSLKLSDVNLEAGEFYVARLKRSDSGWDPFFNAASGCLRAGVVEVA